MFKPILCSFYHVFPVLLQVFLASNNWRPGIILSAVLKLPLPRVSWGKINTYNYVLSLYSVMVKTSLTFTRMAQLLVSLPQSRDQLCSHKFYFWMRRWCHKRCPLKDNGICRNLKVPKRTENIKVFSKLDFWSFQVEKE